MLRLPSRCPAHTPRFRVDLRMKEVPISTSTPHGGSAKRRPRATYSARRGRSPRVPRIRESPGQLAMADAVEKALADDRVLVCEAGTGTGKTLAYLVPAILSGRRS